VNHRGEILSLVDWTCLPQAEAIGQPALLIRRPFVFDRSLDPLLRRFACECCRALDARLTDDGRNALDVIERFVAGFASFEELVMARDSAKLVARRVCR
jgi:hypothetical protein